MSRRFTLDEYLEQFIDEHTEAAGEEIRLHISNAQAQRLGLFFIQCIGGILQSLRSQCPTPVLPGIKREQHDEVVEAAKDEDEFIN